MSFVKKALKKVWSFVKKHWLKIVLVAAVIFTAGVASIGFSAFVGGGFSGFMGAVGSTMWAGVAATAGTLGIGQGAVVGAGGMTAAGGTAVAAGTHVGLGAAWGAGAGAGFGAGVGSNIAGANAEIALQSSASAAFNAAEAAELASGATAAEAAEAGMAAQMSHVNTAMGTASSSTAAGTSITAANTGTGLTLGGVVETAGKLAPIAGAWMMAKGEEEQLNPYNTNAAFGGNQFDGPNASGAPGPGKNFLAPPPAQGGEGAVAGAADPSAAAGGLMQNQQQSVVAPFRGVAASMGARTAPTGEESDKYGGPLMQGAG